MVAVLAVPLTVATSRFARKALLLTTVTGYALSNALVAAAPTFAAVAAGRTVGGVTHALFFSLVIGYAPRLVSRAHVGRALALAGAAPRRLRCRRAAVDVAGHGRRLAGVVRGAGCAVGDHVRSRLGVAAAGESRTGGRCFAGRCPRSARGGGERRTRWCFSASSRSTRSSACCCSPAVSVRRSSGPILLACGACGLVGLWYAGRGLDRNPRRTADGVRGGRGRCRGARRARGRHSSRHSSRLRCGAPRSAAFRRSIRRARCAPMRCRPNAPGRG